jgi:CHAT domain-containing protein
VKGKVATLGDERVELSVAALHFAELAHARGQFDRMSQARYEAMRQRAPKHLQEEEARLMGERQRLRSELLALQAKGEKPGPAQVATLQKLENDAAEYVKAVRKDPEYSLTMGPGIAGIKELNLEKDEVILEYAIGIRSVFLFVVSKEGIEVLSIPAVIDDLVGEVQAFRDLTSTNRFSESLARQLYGELLGRAEAYLKPNDRVIIVPDGFLGILPFEALIAPSAADATNEAFFGVTYRVAYAQSVSGIALARLASAAVGTRPLFALGDPIFDASDPRYTQSALPARASGSDPHPQNPESLADANSGGKAGGYARLAATRDEVDAVAAIMGVKPAPPDVLTDQSADKATFLKSNLGGYRFIHLATHGAALGELGLVNEPFLVFGLPASGRFEDQILTMSEVMNLKLSADLVVLAACESGRGDILQGDGVASLASAFMYAGADSVLLSMWKLPSRPSVFFMQKFYGFLRDRHSKIEALRLSREAMMSRYKDPYYWAVFVLYESGSP